MGQGIAQFARVIWIVLDSVGVGELPDAGDYGDVGRDTLGHIARSRPLHLPNLVRLGLANIKPLDHLAPPAHPAGSRGKGATRVALSPTSAFNFATHLNFGTVSLPYPPSYHAACSNDAAAPHYESPASSRS